MNVLTNIVIEGTKGKLFFADFFYEPTGKPKPVIIFSHGFKGFKDWGHFNFIAKAFAKSGFVFVKFNFSLNGTTLKRPTEFGDLEAFGNNNLTTELNDLGTVINFVLNYELIGQEIDKNKINLMGHSRGGGISILKSADDNRIKKLAVWGSVNEFGSFFPKEMRDEWKSKGVLLVPNSRTNQQMPMYSQYIEDLENNEDRLDIPTAVKQLKTPLLIVHGTNDLTVAYEKAEAMHNWNSQSKLITIKDSGHTFGGSHPWRQQVLPEDTIKAVEATAAFFKN